MLCHNCCNALINTHTLILKALESQKFLKEKYCLQIKFETDNLTRLGNSQFAETEFETVLVEKIELEPMIDDYFVYDGPGEEVAKKPVKQVKESAVVGKPIRPKTRGTKSKTEVKADEPLKEHPNHSLEMSTSKRKSAVRVKKSKTVDIAANNINNINTDSGSSKEEKQEECSYTETDSKDDIKNIVAKDEKKCKEKKNFGICSICCKYLSSYQQIFNTVVT